MDRPDFARQLDGREILLEKLRRESFYGRSEFEIISHCALRREKRPWFGCDKNWSYDVAVNKQFSQKQATFPLQKTSRDWQQRLLTGSGKSLSPAAGC